MEVLSNSTTILSTDCLTRKRIRQQPPQLPPNKRICSHQTPSWSDDLPDELLETIMSKLTFFDVQNFKAVCSSWHRAATSFRHSPLLMLPSLPPLFETSNESGSSFLYSLKQETIYENKNMPDVFQDSWIVGSSNGFLILLDRKADPYLLNMFSRRVIKLPPKETLPHIRSVHHDDESDRVEVFYDHEYQLQGNMTFDNFRKHELIEKAILSDDNNFVIIFHCQYSELAYCRQSDAEWTNLDCRSSPYADILFSKNKLYALSQNSSIQVWDFNGSSPMKQIDMTHTMLSEPRNHLSSDLYSTHWYLAESGGDILYVERYVGEFVKDGKPIYEADLLPDDDTTPLICPYQTLDFKVYKIDFNIKVFSRLESLGDRALFLGWNHAASLSADEHTGCEGNSIYFTDNYRERMDEDYSYGGHDMGVYSMKKGTVRQFLEIEEMKILPPPFWVLPRT